MAVATECGRVARHTSLGGAVFDAQEAKRQEDAESKAGMRDPARLAQSWPQLWAGMTPIADALRSFRDERPDLRDLRRCLGSQPERQPPTEASLHDLRCRIGEVLGLTAAEVEERHPAAPWRHRLVNSTQALCGDPDIALSSWLSDGAPMGITLPIVPGGLFPLLETPCCHCPRRCVRRSLHGQPPILLGGWLGSPRPASYF